MLLRNNTINVGVNVFIPGGYKEIASILADQ
jgi:hypothetical protein